jgi:hypothetical protein
VACKAERATQLVVGASTQMRVPHEIAAMRVVVRGDASGTLACETRALEGPAPQSFAISVTGLDGEQATAVAAGFAGPAPADPCSVDGALVVRRARTHFEGGEHLYLPMPLRRSCAGVACSDSQTCAGGACVDAEVRSGNLVTYDETLTADEGSFCFPRVDCFEDVVPALLVDPQDCTFQLPDEVPDDAINRGFGNLEILHEDLSREVLDLDPVEGFSRVPDHKDRFRIARGLCDRYRARKITALYIGGNCPPKEALRPMCRPPAAAGPPPPEDVLCTSADELLPTPAAIYLLVDRSSAMRDELPKLREAIDLALQAQFVRNAKVALHLLPAAQSACTASPSPFSTLAGPEAVPFASPDQARGPIAALLGTPALADNPPLFLDAALRDAAAYQALLAPAGIGRHYVVAIGNRDFIEHCAPTLGTPAQEAFVQSRDHAVTTAALLVGAPAGFDSGRDPYLDALALARAGGGPFGDGSLDKKGLHAAVGAFVTEIGSCHYELPKTIDASGDLAKVKMSYFDVLTSLRVDLPWDPACGDGWRIEQGRIHLCGAACNELRFKVATAAAYAIDHGFVPVEDPMRWAAPCR